MVVLLSPEALSQELENNKRAIYRLYNIDYNDIVRIFKYINVRTGAPMSDHLISKFKGYNNNSILFIHSIDSNIRKDLFKEFKLESVICHDFFVWYNYTFNNGRSIDNYCSYEFLLDDYYGKSFNYRNQIVANFCRIHLKNNSESFFY